MIGQKAISRALAAGGAALVLTSFASGARAQGAEAASVARAELPPPAARKNVLLAGVGITTFFSGLGLLSSLAFSPSDPGSSELKIPIAGPWLALANTRCPATEPDCGAKPFLLAANRIIVGLGQVGGLAVIGEGVFLRTGAPEASHAKRRRPAKVRAIAVPVMHDRGAGAAVTGIF